MGRKTDGRPWEYRKRVDPLRTYSGSIKYTKRKRNSFSYTDVLRVVRSLKIDADLWLNNPADYICLYIMHIYLSVVMGNKPLNKVAYAITQVENYDYFDQRKKKFLEKNYGKVMREIFSQYKNELLSDIIDLYKKFFNFARKLLKLFST